MRQRTVGALLITMIVAVLSLSAPRVFAAGTDPEQAAKERDIRQMMELSGAAKVLPQVLDTMLNSFAKALLQVPPEYWAGVRKEINAQDLINLVIPIYDRHFSHDEIRQLIAFYQSPVGTKLSSEMGAITQESMVAGQAWGKAVGQHVLQQLRDKGYLKDQ